MDHEDCYSAIPSPPPTTTFLLPDAPPPDVDEELSVDEVRPECPPNDEDEHLRLHGDTDWPLPNPEPSAPIPEAETEVSAAGMPSLIEVEEEDEEGGDGDHRRSSRKLDPASGAIAEHTIMQPEHPTPGALDATPADEKPSLVDAETEGESHGSERAQSPTPTQTPSATPMQSPTRTSGGTGGPGKQECSLCHKQFANVYRLERHRLSHQEGDELRRFRCTSCTKAFKVCSLVMQLTCVLRLNYYKLTTRASTLDTKVQCQRLFMMMLRRTWV